MSVLPDPDPQAVFEPMVRPETLSVGAGDRELAHQIAQAAVAALIRATAPAQVWWVIQPNGWVKVTGRLAGGPIRTFEIDPLAAIEPQIAARRLEMEGQGG